MNADDMEDLIFLANTPAQAKSLLHKQQEGMVSVWTQIKFSSHILNKMKPSLH